MKPNIVFILADDYGWRDTACYGSSFYETPNLDALARGGLRFTNAYATCPVCSPSRASLLTGKYPARVGITNYIDWSGKSHPSRGLLWDAPYRKGLPDGETTLADALRHGGYQTWHVGKWHLGETGHLPRDHGFDVNIGGSHFGSPHKGYFAPWHLPEMPQEDIPEGTYLTDYLTDRALRLMKDRDPARPFFLNLWHYAVHTPIQAPEPLVEKYREKARRMRLDSVNALVEGEPFPCHHKRNSRVKRRVIQSDPAYAALVENLDTNVGRILLALDELGLADDTLVVYSSDNGGLATAEGSPTCNHPLAEGKGWMYDGGIREPLIARWPRRIAPGTTSDAVTTGTDLFPTLLEAAGLPPLPEQHVDGVSLMPVLAGREGEYSRGPVFWHFPHYGNQGGTPAAAVRDGDWKLIRFFEDERRALHNLATDIGEAFDCAAAHPDVAAKLDAQLDRWLADIGALLPKRCEAGPDIAQLNQRFGLPGQAAFREGPGGLPILTIVNPHGTLELTPYGGHVLSYQPAGQAEVLFVSRESAYLPGKPIRGGIPVCWPWFGPRPDDPALPMHGFARLLFWDVESVDIRGDETEVRLGLRDDARTRKFWPHAFELTLRVVLGKSLVVELTTRNTGPDSFVLTQALHTYFAVGAIGRVVIEGLESASYFDSLTRLPMAPEAEPIAIRAEIDRVYVDTADGCLIRDASLDRQIRVAKRGSRATVVWNPWIEKSKRMPDFGDDEFSGMVCIEAANARDDAISLAPGQSHTLAQILSVQRATRPR